MTGDDLKHMQDGFLDGAQKILRKDGRLRHVGFVITLHKHVDKLFESGWGLEFLDPKACLHGDQDDTAALVIDLTMDWKRLYHAVLNVFPQTRSMLPGLIAFGESAHVDDAYMRVMRAFLNATEMDEKDVVSATMRQICGQVDAFASILQSEAWLRVVESSESLDEIYNSAPKGLEQDQKSVEVVMSVMETYDFTRMITVPIQRDPTSSDKRDAGKVLGFGTPIESLASPEGPNAIEGRMVRFLKPLKEAS